MTRPVVATPFDRLRAADQTARAHNTIADASALLRLAGHVAVAAMLLLERVEAQGDADQAQASEHVAWALRQFAENRDVIALRRRFVEPFELRVR